MSWLRSLNAPNLSFNAIRKNKILLKISELILQYAHCALFRLH